MNIIEVIPIRRGMAKESLSYFTSKEIPLGALVDVPVRSKKIHGIVIAVHKAEDMKGEIKNASFSLKKIDTVKSVTFFTPEFMSMIQKLAHHYATTTGAVLDILAPEYILKNVPKLKKHEEEGTRPEKKLPHISAVQGDDDERYGTWKSLIRQEFARKKSVLILTPTIEDAERSFELIEKGIEGYAFMLHGGLNTKKMIETWNKIMNEVHPVVVVTTGGFLSLQRPDIETLIVERESSRSYKIPRRPYLDIRTAAELWSKERNIKLYYADSFLRIETLYRQSEGEIIEGSPFKFRSLSTARDTLVDMKKYKQKDGKDFIVFSDEMAQAILQTKVESEHMIILTSRRGLAPSIVCADCQTIVTCKSCSTPVVLHKGKGKDFFMCHTCGERRSAEEYCTTCESWNLRTMGIGIDLIYDRVHERFPDMNIFRIDADSTPTDAHARAVYQKFRAQPGSILMGTEMMLQYIHDKVETAGIISLDSLFSLPDFRIQEKILGQLIRIRSLTTQDFIVQTRKSDEKVFEYGLKGNMSDFYRTEIEERKRFSYPPFTELIKITLEGEREHIVEEMKSIQEKLAPEEVEVFPAFTQTVKGNFVLHGLIRLPRSSWPHRTIIEALRALPPHVVVKVDPETLL